MRNSSRSAVCSTPAPLKHNPHDSAHTGQLDRYHAQALRKEKARERPVPVAQPFDHESEPIWAMDITYIPMARGFVYLAAVIDWHSRRVLAWRLSISMDTAFCTEAIEEAIARCGEPEIFNTVQGSQLGFKVSSQHPLVERQIVGHQALQQACSIPTSYEAGHLAWPLQRRDHVRCTCSYRCPWGSTGAVSRWCSR